MVRYTTLAIVISLYISVEIKPFQSWCQLGATGQAYDFSYSLPLQRPARGFIPPVYAPMCYVALADDEKEVLTNILYTINSKTQLRSLPMVKNSLLKSFADQVRRVKGEAATVEDALDYLR